MSDGEGDTRTVTDNPAAVMMAANVLVAILRTLNICIRRSPSCPSISVVRLAAGGRTGNRLAFVDRPTGARPYAGDVVDPEK